MKEVLHVDVQPIKADKLVQPRAFSRRSCTSLIVSRCSIDFFLDVLVRGFSISE